MPFHPFANIYDTIHSKTEKRVERLTGQTVKNYGKTPPHIERAGASVTFLARLDAFDKSWFAGGLRRSQFEENPFTFANFVDIG